MIIPVGFAQVNMKYTGAAAPRGAQVVFGVDNTVPTVTASDIADVVIAAWDDNFQVVTSPAATLASVLVKLGPNSTGLFAEVTANLAGGSAGTAVDPQVSVLYTKETLTGGRTGRGRMFLPFVDEEYTTSGGGYTPSGVTDFQAAADGFLADLITADLPMVLLHAEGAEAPHVVTALTLQPLVATQRRRVRRVGGRRTTP